MCTVSHVFYDCTVDSRYFRKVYIRFIYMQCIVSLPMGKLLVQQGALVKTVLCVHQQGWECVPVMGGLCIQHLLYTVQHVTTHRQLALQQGWDCVPALCIIIYYSYFSTTTMYNFGNASTICVYSSTMGTLALWVNNILAVPAPMGELCTIGTLCILQYYSRASDTMLQVLEQKWYCVPPMDEILARITVTPYG